MTPKLMFSISELLWPSDVSSSCCLVTKSCLTPVAHQAPLSMGFPRQEYRSGLPFPPPGDLPDPGIKLMSLVSPSSTGGLFTTEPPGKPDVSSAGRKILHQNKLTDFTPPPNSDIWVGLRHNTSSHPKLHATAVEIWSLYQCQRSWNKAGGLKQQKWLLHSSRGEKSEIRISSGLCCLCNL